MAFLTNASGGPYGGVPLVLVELPCSDLTKHECKLGASGEPGLHISPILLASPLQRRNRGCLSKPTSMSADEVFPQCGVIFGKVFV